MICFQDEDEETIKYIECFFCGKKIKERGLKNHERKCEDRPLPSINLPEGFGCTPPPVINHETLVVGDDWKEVAGGWSYDATKVAKSRPVLRHPNNLTKSEKKLFSKNEAMRFYKLNDESPNPSGAHGQGHGRSKIAYKKYVGNRLSDLKF